MLNNFTILDPGSHIEILASQILDKRRLRATLFRETHLRRELIVHKKSLFLKIVDNPKKYISLEV